jgi:hypothetical protein
MQWIGYVDPMANAVASTEPFVTYSLNDARTSGAHYAMINLSESDCPGCQQDATLMESGDSTATPAVLPVTSVVQAGGVVIEVLETTGFVTQATQTSLQQWIGKYQLMVTSVKDPDGTGTATLTALGGREHCYIVDLTTMKILDFITGDDLGGGTDTQYSAAQCMAEMHTLLGK